MYYSQTSIIFVCQQDECERFIVTRADCSSLAMDAEADTICYRTRMDISKDLG